jgi:predicted AAA+ superfamily ATPase
MDNLIKRFYRAPKDSFFIFGPRGTGKSTWIKHHFKDAFLISLLDERTYLTYLSNPGHLKELVVGNRDTYKIYVIDEVQKIPSILDSIHELIENYKDLQFILTGSSARKLKREGVNLLAGRAIQTKMFPFMAAELQHNFNLNQALENGLVPLIVNSNNPTEKIATYLSLYLKEEVQSEGLVRNVGDFARFLEVISFSHGSILNYSNVARECGVSRKIVENYVSILEDLLIANLLPVFTKRAKRQLVSHAKFYYFDTGIFFHLRPKGILDKVSEVSGVALEGLVFQHLNAWCNYSIIKHELFFWRTKSGSEVDFIIYGPEYFVAIEVKNSTNVNTKDLYALKQFKEDYPECKTMLLYRGENRIVKDNILCIPVQQFLLALVPDKFPK